MKGILVTGCFPAIIRAESLMKIWVPPKKEIIAPSSQIITSDSELITFNMNSATFAVGDIISIGNCRDKRIYRVHALGPGKVIIQPERKLIYNHE